jgi:hypothetical protein
MVTVMAMRVVGVGDAEGSRVVGVVEQSEEALYKMKN